MWTHTRNIHLSEICSLLLHALGYENNQSCGHFRDQWTPTAPSPTETNIIHVFKTEGINWIFNPYMTQVWSFSFQEKPISSKSGKKKTCWCVNPSRDYQPQSYFCITKNSSRRQTHYVADWPQIDPLLLVLSRQAWSHPVRVCSAEITGYCSLVGRQPTCSSGEGNSAGICLLILRMSLW